jgi:acyl carrier protein
MTPADPNRNLMRLIAAEVGLDPSDIDSDLLIGDIGMDSLTFMELLVRIEDELRVRVDTEKLQPVLREDSSIGDLIAGLKSAFVEVNP